MEPEVAPGVKHPSTYCNFCEIDLLKIERHRQHLIGLHDSDIEISGELEPLSDAIIRANCYCLACEKTLSDKTKYYEHLKRKQKMKF